MYFFCILLFLWCFQVCVCLHGSCVFNACLYSCFVCFDCFLLFFSIVLLFCFYCICVFLLCFIVFYLCFIVFVVFYCCPPCVFQCCFGIFSSYTTSWLKNINMILLLFIVVLLLFLLFSIVLCCLLWFILFLHVLFYCFCFKTTQCFSEFLSVFM